MRAGKRAKEARRAAGRPGHLQAADLMEHPVELAAERRDDGIRIAAGQHQILPEHIVAAAGYLRQRCLIIDELKIITAGRHAAVHRIAQRRGGIIIIADMRIAARCDSDVLQRRRAISGDIAGIAEPDVLTDDGH